MPAYLLIDDVIVPYLQATSRTRRASTQQSEESYFRRLDEYFRGWRLCDDARPTKKTITGKVVMQYREYRKSQGISPQTVKRELALAARAVNWMMSEAELDIAKNPFQGRLNLR